MTENLSKYIEITEKCAEQCTAMLEFEQEKRRALLSGDGRQLESTVAAQQAAIMALDMLEKRRISAQQAAGYATNVTASDVLESMAEGLEKEHFGEVLGRMGRAVEEIRELNKTALEIANMNLQIFGRSSQSTVYMEKKVTYSPGQTKQSGWSGGSSFEQKF